MAPAASMPAAAPGCGCLRPRAASPGDPDATPPRTPHSCTTRGSRGGIADFKSIESIGTVRSEMSIRHFPRAHSRLMGNAARALGLRTATDGDGRGPPPARGGSRPRLAKLLVLNPQRVLRKAKSIAAKEGANAFGWEQFVSTEVINLNPLDHYWQNQTVKVIKINVTTQNAHQRDAVQWLLNKPAHFPGSIYSVELTNCHISAVPAKLAGHGDLRALRLMDNNIAELPKGWLGPEGRHRRANSEGSRTSRMSGWWPPLAGLLRSRSLSPTVPPGAERTPRSPFFGSGRWSTSSEQVFPGEGSGESSGAGRPEAPGEGPAAEEPRDRSPARSAASPSPRKSALKAKGASSPSPRRDPRRKVTLNAEGARAQLPAGAIEGARAPSELVASPATTAKRGERSVRSLITRASSWLTRDKYQPAQPQLEELRLDRNRLGWIERGALSGGLVEDLRVLNLGHNQLSFLPEDFLEGASKLRLLDLSNNQLERVRLAESLLSREGMLEVLLLEGNRLTALPARLPRGLRRLGVSYNRLSELPSDIGRYRRLESIRMASNRIRILPDSMLDLWPAKGNGGRLAELQVEENPLIQPSITAFQMGGMDAAFEQFEDWVYGKEPQYQPAPAPAPVEPEPLPPLWAVSLESLRFPGFYLDAEGTQVRASSVAPPVVPDAGGGGKYSLWLREYAHGVVSLEGAHSRGLFVSALGADMEYRDVHLAAPRPGGDAECHFRSRASEGGLVTFESLCFPGFFLNVYGSGASQKHVQLVPEEPRSPESQKWGFFRMARAPLLAEPVRPPPEPAVAGQGSSFLDEEGERGNTAGVGKRMSISPMRSIVRGVQSIQIGVRRIGAITSTLAVDPVNSMGNRRGHSPGSRRLE